MEFYYYQCVYPPPSNSKISILLEYMGRNTLIPMCIHQPLILICSLINIKFIPINVLLIGKCILIIFSSYLISFFIYKYVPFVSKKKKA